MTRQAYFGQRAGVAPPTARLNWTARPTASVIGVDIDSLSRVPLPDFGPSESSIIVVDVFAGLVAGQGQSGRGTEIGAVTRYRRKTSVLSQMFEGDTVLYDGATERYFSLNEVGTEVWNTLKEPRELTAIVDSIVSQFEVEVDLARKDVTELLERLEQAALIDKE